MSLPAWVLRRQQIERAQQQAREAVLAMREAEVEQMAALLDELAEAIAERLQQLAGDDGRVPVEALALIETLVVQLIDAYAARWREQLRTAMAQAVALGLGITAPPPAAGAGLGAAAAGASMAGVGTALLPGSALARVLAFVEQFVAADGLALSDRLWRLSRGLTDATLDTLRAALVRGSDAARLATELAALGRAVPAEIAAVLGDDRAAALARTLREAITGEGGTPLRNLSRLFRTEINRAHTEGFVTGLGEVDGVAGVKFTLSPLHPRFDVCDLHAAANIHGLGPGVYPLGNHPYPAHPETLSYLQPVFVDEVTDDDRAGQQSAFDWLRTQPADKQDGVLGGQRKGEAFRAGQLLPDELRLPWYVVKDRLGLSS